MDEEIPYNELLLDVEDGIVVGLYHYLWLKDGKGRACPEVNVPHTVIICNGRPKVWYFTSGKERCIKRKNRTNINNATITEALAPQLKPATTKSNGDASASAAAAPGGDSLLGTWGISSSSPQRQQQQPQAQPQGHRRNQLLESQGGGGGGVGRVPDGTSTGTALGPWPHHGVVARFQGSMTMPHNAGGTANRGASLGRRRKGFELQDEAVEFFTREQMAEILPPGTAVVHGVAALHEGVLQRFVQPRGQHHFSIRATWSPNACVVERRTSKGKLNDPRVSLVERLAGWDGPNWMSDHTLITGTVLHGGICRLCDNVAAHLADVSSGGVRVLRMVLFFCVDEANRIWLTHCGTLKTQRLQEYVAAGPHLHQLPSRLRGGMPHLLPSPSVALRLRSPDGGGSGGGALSGDPSLDLPAPSAAFVASKAAVAATAGSEGGDGGGGGRFLCVLAGEMYPASQRCDVTYKQLLQHWFSLASQLPNEGDRLRAMDTIPLAIRRANPSLTREWYLRVRSQPTFLYRTAPVCLDAAAQITGLALDELQRTVLPPPPGSGVAAAGLTAAAAPGPGNQVGNPGVGLLAGWGGAGTLTHGSPPVTARGGVDDLSRQTTSNTTAAVRVQLAGAPSVRQRPATALPPAGPSSHFQQQLQPVSFRSGSRLQQQQQAQMQQQAATTSRRFVPRSKSASPSVATSRLAPTTNVVGGGGGRGGHANTGGGLPSMLMPRESGQHGIATAGSGAGGALGRMPSFLQVYGPTPEQAAEAAAAAEALPYEVLDEAQQLADDDADGAEVARAKDGEADTLHGGRGVNNNSGYQDDDDASDGASTATDGSRPKPHDTGATASGVAASQPSTSASAALPAGSGAGAGSSGAGAGGGDGSGSPRQRAGPGPASGYTAAAASATTPTAPRPSTRSSRFPAGRMSTSSEITEMGSVASFSDPASPNGTHPGPYHSQSHAAATTPTSSSSRMSPPRSAGLTLHTIHEEGAAAAGAPPPPSGRSGRAGSPLAGAELIFPPPSRGGAGSHSVPRMRPPSRVSMERQLASAGAGRRHAAAAQVYGHHHGGGGSGGGSGALRGSFSESGDLPALPGAGGGMGSLNSTMASSVGSQSRRSTSNQAVLSTEDMRTLRELNEAYTAAEKLTQQLLAQAHEILSEDGGSRPGSTGTSPVHGGRRPPTSSRGATPTSRPCTGNSGITAGGVRQPSCTGSGGGASASGLVRAGSGSARPGTAVQRPNGSPQAPTAGLGLGPSPLGQRDSYLVRTGSSNRASFTAAAGGDSDAATAAADRSQHPAVSAAAPALPPVLLRVGSAASGFAQEAAESRAGTGTGAAAEGADGGGVTAAAASVGSVAATTPGSHQVPADMDLLTSAEADLLAEALQD